MRRTTGFVIFALALLPQLSAAQLVLRDDTDGWGWLALTTNRRAIVQLAYASQGDEQGSLDAEILELLRNRGVRRLFGHDSFEPGESQVLAECTGTDWTPAGSSQVQIAIHAEVSYWDHTRLAPTEIYEAITVGAVERDRFSHDAYVEGCARVITGVLSRLGFNRG